MNSYITQRFAHIFDLFALNAGRCVVSMRTLGAPSTSTTCLSGSLISRVGRCLCFEVIPSPRVCLGEPANERVAAYAEVGRSPPGISS